MNTETASVVMAKPLRAVREIIDEDFITNGDDFGRQWTQAELDEQHRLGDLLSLKLAEGFSMEQINAAWKDKSTAEILAEADNRELLSTV